ncbi:chitin deacetylase 8-like [Anthonomus grandis grandis]|uniref:chitin deacetylase 8-like n=1 Tax=Anthonomus grandis grandis TaxID=2921223 RepID=UPI0021654D14|nr:chitin deacetylase 8-like [Anthonomus grandis grandis]
MKFSILSLVLLIGIFNKIRGDAEVCDDSVCTIDNNCRCASVNGPLALEDTPQLVVLAFVDAATQDLYKNVWGPLVEPRKNPDGEFISATFYLPHEYTDYQIVHDLAVFGFEIAAHSVTNNPHQEYWRNANESLLESEFGDQKKIIAKFANIPESAVKGTLVPQLVLAGDSSITAFVKQGFVYDNSWTSKTSLYPYTLDYASDQNCDTGSNCPKESHPGFWIAPIIDLIAGDGDVCATIAACFRDSNTQTAQEISDWLVNQIQTVKNSNRAPLTLIIEDNLFKSVNESWAGLNDALDRIQEDKEIFLVSQSRVIEWMKNPTPLSEFKTAAETVDTGCVKNTCALKNPSGDERYMVSCVPCPQNYPWLGNPEGQ